MSELLGRLVRRVGGMTVLILVLLSICLASLVWVLSTVVRGLDPELLIALTLVGAVSGWLLGRWQVRALVVVAAAILIAWLAAFVRVGRLEARLLELAGATASTLGNAQFGRLNVQPMAEAVESLVTAGATLVTRVQAWSGGLISGEPVYEPVALAMLWGFLVCLVAAWAAWRLRRSARAFDALLPLVLLLALVTGYAGRDAWALFLVLCAWFGLLAVVPQFERERRWEREKVGFAEGLGFDLAMVAVPAIIVSLALAAVTPVISPQEIARWVRPLTESNSTSSQVISDSFGIEPAPRPRTALDMERAPGLPRSHLLSAGPELLESLALTVQIDNEANVLPVRYWLGTVYDEYTGSGWYSSDFRTQDYAAGERVSDVVRPAERLLHQTVQIENAPGLVYAAGVLESVDQPFQVAWRQADDKFGAQVSTNSYRVESYVPGFDADALRAAGEDYPDWVRAQYLYVPDEMPARVLALARDLTATEPTPYDRARAIEAYLQTIPYSLDVPVPPTDVDVVDYFLFELQRGYCDYYATAMAMLARAAGIPARVAVGYAAGDYDPATRTYRVTGADAHSWTQLYFPNYGWVDFEPTSGRTILAYDAPDGFAARPPDFRIENVDSISGVVPSRFEQVWFIVPAALALIVLSGLGGLVMDTLILRRAAPTEMIQRLYKRVVRFARAMGLPIPAGMTPYQLGGLLDDSFAVHAGSGSSRVWRSIAPVIQSLVGEYVQTTYGAQDRSETDAARLIQNWQAVRLRLGLVLALNALEKKRNALRDFLNGKTRTGPRRISS